MRKFGRKTHISHITLGERNQNNKRNFQHKLHGDCSKCLSLTSYDAEVDSCLYFLENSQYSNNNDLQFFNTTSGMVKNTMSWHFVSSKSKVSDGQNTEPFRRKERKSASCVLICVSLLKP